MTIILGVVGNMISAIYTGGAWRLAAHGVWHSFAGAVFDIARFLRFPGAHTGYGLLLREGAYVQALFFSYVRNDYRPRHAAHKYMLLVRAWLHFLPTDCRRAPMAPQRMAECIFRHY